MSEELAFDETTKLAREAGIECVRVERLPEDYEVRADNDELVWRPADDDQVVFVFERDGLKCGVPVPKQAVTEMPLPNLFVAMRGLVDVGFAKMQEDREVE